MTTGDTQMMGARSHVGGRALFLFVVLFSGLVIARGGDVEPTVNIITNDVEGGGDRGVEHKATAADTALHRAAVRGDAAGVAAAIADGAAVDSFYPAFGLTALMLAAGRDDAASLALLIGAGADLEQKESTHGWTALFLAANRGHAGAVRLLLERGAAWDLRDATGQWTPFASACYGNHRAAADALLADVRAEGDVDAQLRAVDDGGATPLMRSIAQGTANTEMVAWLIEAGSPLEATQAGGQTPLMLAARAGREDVVLLLLAAGAAVDSTGETAIGRTALQYVAAAYEHGAPPERTARLVAVARALLAAGADAGARDKIRQTAADAARERLARTRPKSQEGSDPPPLFGQLLAVLEGAAESGDESGGGGREEL